MECRQCWERLMCKLFIFGTAQEKKKKNPPENHMFLSYLFLWKIQIVSHSSTIIDAITNRERKNKKKNKKKKKLCIGLERLTIFRKKANNFINFFFFDRLMSSCRFSFCFYSPFHIVTLVRYRKQYLAESIFCTDVLNVKLSFRSRPTKFDLKHIIIIT